MLRIHPLQLLENHMSTIATHRTEIDRIDQQLLKLLNERATHAMAIGAIKIASGDTEMYRPEREAQVLSNYMEKNEGPIPNAEIARLFREIMSTCLSLEKPLQIAFLGPEKTFSELAAKKQFGGSADLVPQATIPDVFRAVETGQVDFGVVPVENSTEGAVNLTLDCFAQTSLSICGETTLRIHQNLISSAKTVQDVQKVFAHPQSLAQCRGWLDKHLPNAERIACHSNVEALKQSQLAPESSAALASEEAAQFYEIPILARYIEDDTSNTTRFLVIGHKKVPESGDDKTTFIVSANDRPGLLNQLIEPLSAHSVTMTRIESRPAKHTMWGYLFYIDILGHQADIKVQKALNEIENRASLLKILGSYPKARY